MRARLSLAISGQHHVLREVVLRDKPAAMITASAKATVPVLVLPDETVLEQSIDIMDWALGLNDPDNWLAPDTGTLDDIRALITESDGSFKDNLDRYKYANRYEGADPVSHRSEGMEFLQKLNARLADQPFLAGQRASLADFAIFPFIRQFANTDRDWFDAQDMKPLQSWLGKHLDSDLFTGVMTKRPQWKPGDAETQLP